MIPVGARVWIAMGHTDMRRGMQSLAAMVEQHFTKDSFDGEGAYNTAAYMPRRRELATIWSDILSDGLHDPTVLIERPSKVISDQSRCRLPDPVATDFRFPKWRRAA